jgi:hypothetical protein
MKKKTSKESKETSEISDFDIINKFIDISPQQKARELKAVDNLISYLPSNVFDFKFIAGYCTTIGGTSLNPEIYIKRKDRGITAKNKKNRWAFELKQNHSEDY